VHGIGEGVVDLYMKELQMRLALVVLQSSLMFKHSAYTKEAEYRFLDLHQVGAVPGVSSGTSPMCCHDIESSIGRSQRQTLCKPLRSGRQLTKSKESDLRMIACGRSIRSTPTGLQSTNHQFLTSHDDCLASTLGEAARRGASTQPSALEN